MLVWVCKYQLMLLMKKEYDWDQLQKKSFRIAWGTNRRWVTLITRTGQKVKDICLKKKWVGIASLSGGENATGPLKKCKKKKCPKKFNFQRNNLINPRVAFKKKPGIKNASNCNLPPYGLPKKKCKKCDFWPKPKMQKMEKKWKKMYMKSEKKWRGKKDTHTNCIPAQWPP